MLQQENGRLILGCPRKLGSMGSKWVISPNYLKLEYIGITTHLLPLYYLPGTQAKWNNTSSTKITLKYGDFPKPQLPFGGPGRVRFL